MIGKNPSTPSAAEVLIRHVRPDEGPAVARVHVQADAETYRPIFGERFRAEKLIHSEARWNTALAGGDVFLVATDAGAIVGLGHVRGDWMSALYLLTSHHRRGVGARLLAELCAAVRDRGVGEIGFQCVADNAAAIAFYEAQGARQTGRKTEGEGDGAWEDVIFRLATDPLAASRRR
jgi:GNAT superfamily N-acetyltransferase